VPGEPVILELFGVDTAQEKTTLDFAAESRRIIS